TMRTALDQAIELVTDGKLVDWTVLVASAESDAERRALQQLRDLAGAFEPACDTSDDARPVVSPGQWGHLRLIEEIGRGAHGVVFRAWDTRLEREVALKLLDHSSRDATLQEAQRLARVSHPSIVAIHGVDQKDDCMGLWMELLRGDTLDAIVRRQGPFSARE